MTKSAGARRQKAGASTAGLTLVGDTCPKQRKRSGKDWNKTKETAFLSALAETCNVTLAAAEAGVSISAAYTRRKRDAAFRTAWREAIGAAYQRLELILLDRAFNGTEKIITRKDGSEGRMREYSDALGLQLLKMHRATAIEADPASAPDDIDELRERLYKKLERMRVREEARGASE